MKGGTTRRPHAHRPTGAGSRPEHGPGRGRTASARRVAPRLPRRSQGDATNDTCDLPDSAVNHGNASTLARKDREPQAAAAHSRRPCQLPRLRTHGGLPVARGTHQRSAARCPPQRTAAPAAGIEAFPARPVREPARCQRTPASPAHRPPAVGRDRPVRTDRDADAAVVAEHRVDDEPVGDLQDGPARARQLADPTAVTSVVDADAHGRSSATGDRGDNSCSPS